MVEINQGFPANQSQLTDGSGRITQVWFRFFLNVWRRTGGDQTTLVTSVATGTGLTGGPITSEGTISLANTAVTPGSYTKANITVDQQGRITAASSGAPAGLSNTYNFDATTPGNVTSMTFVNGVLTAVTTL